MIKGLGSDIIAVGRIQKVIDRQGDRFLTSVFTDREIAYCQRYQRSAPHFAARFAAKEALVKALGTGLRHGLTWKDIEITHDALGKPQIELSDKAQTLIGSGHFLVTLSHCHDYATATVVYIA